MDLVKLTENIVKSLVVNVDAVSVKEFPTDEENVMLIQVVVDSADMGRVIGKKQKPFPLSLHMRIKSRAPSIM